MRHRPPSEADLKRQVDCWNGHHAPDTKGCFFLDRISADAPVPVNELGG